MPSRRRVTPSQFRSIVRREQSRRRQQINKLNSAIRNYNRAAHAHNSKVRRNRQELKSAITRLQQTNVASTSLAAYRTSTYNLDTAYTHLEQYDHLDEDDPRGVFLQFAALENDNSIAAASALISGEVSEPTSTNLQATSIEDELISISSDLHHRWMGALFSLAPGNPDAARHFCTSARELVAGLLDLGAPDEEVLAQNPDCAKTEKGTPTRREKVQYLVNQKGLPEAEFGDFVEEDIDNVTKLFRTFNDATHGHAGVFDLSTLQAVKIRVEGAIFFLTALINDDEDD